MKEKRKILAVDDNPTIRAVFEELLGSQYILITASTGEEALKILQKFQPDLIVLDIMMLGMKGPEVAARLREDLKTKEIPIIFLTGLISKEEQKKKGYVGKNIFLAKPFDSEELLSLIETLLCS